MANKRKFASALTRSARLLIIVMKGLIKGVQDIDSAFLLEHLLNTPRHSPANVMVSRQLESADTLVVTIKLAENVVLAEDLLGGEAAVADERMFLLFEESLFLLISGEDDRVREHTALEVSLWRTRERAYS